MNTTNPEAASKEAKVSAAQARVLAAAAAHPEGIVELASKTRDRAGRNRTVEALAKLGLIRPLMQHPEGETAPDATSPNTNAWTITAAGLRAIGAPDVMLSGQPPLGSEEGSDRSVADDQPAEEGAIQPEEEQAKPISDETSRDASGASSNKSELLLGLLRREEGVSLEALIETSGWQAHSVRGFLSGTVRKRLGLTLISEKDDAGARRYRIGS